MSKLAIILKAGLVYLSLIIYRHLYFCLYFALKDYSYKDVILNIMWMPYGLHIVFDIILAAFLFIMFNSNYITIKRRRFKLMEYILYLKKDAAKYVLIIIISVLYPILRELRLLNIDLTTIYGFVGGIEELLYGVSADTQSLLYERMSFFMAVFTPLEGIFASSFIVIMLYKLLRYFFDCRIGRVLQ